MRADLYLQAVLHKHGSGCTIASIMLAVDLLLLLLFLPDLCNSIHHQSTALFAYRPDILRQR